MENLDENKIFEEAGKLYKCDDGGYDLWAIEAFTEGALLALKIHKEGKVIPNENIVQDGFIWAKNILSEAVENKLKQDKEKVLERWRPFLETETLLPKLEEFEHSEELIPETYKAAQKCGLLEELEFVVPSKEREEEITNSMAADLKEAIDSAIKKENSVEEKLFDINGVEIKEGGELTYTIGDKPIYSLVTGDHQPSDPHEITCPVVRNNKGVLCLINEQGVKMPIKNFMKFKPVFSI